MKIRTYSQGGHVYAEVTANKSYSRGYMRTAAASAVADVLGFRHALTIVHHGTTGLVFRTR